MKILGFCGSLRTASFNRKLLFNALDVLKTKGCETTFIDLRELELPLYDGDLEDKSGMPSGAQKLVDAALAADALVIGCPEYNGGITGVLKNTIDWMSRADTNPFPAKPILLVGTSSGWFGAVKSHMIARLILTHLRALVVPTQVTIPLAEKAFDEKDKLKDPLAYKNLATGCDDLIFQIKAKQK